MSGVPQRFYFSFYPLFLLKHYYNPEIALAQPCRS
jgi:hypothetical protein